MVGGRAVAHQEGCMGKKSSRGTRSIEGRAAPDEGINWIKKSSYRAKKKKKGDTSTKGRSVAGDRGLGRGRTEEGEQEV